MADADPRPAPTVAEIEARLDAGEWLGLDDLAILFGKDKSTIARWVRDYRRMSFRRAPAGGRRAKIYCNPVHVRALLDEWRREHGGENAPKT